MKRETETTLSTDPAPPARDAGLSTAHGSVDFFSRCASCGCRLAADAVSATFTVRAGVAIHFCRACSVGNRELPLRSTEVQS